MVFRNMYLGRAWWPGPRRVRGGGRPIHPTRPSTYMSPSPWRPFTRTGINTRPAERPGTRSNAAITTYRRRATG